MAINNRADTISALAAAMGAGEFAQTKYEEARFDTETGTLYCNGYVISKSIIDNALNHFKMLQNKCDTTDPSQRQMALIYATAVEAIKFMQPTNVKDGGQLVVQGE